MATVVATDRDDPEEAYGEIEYSLLNSDENGAPMFEIDGKTGEVYTLTSNLDREVLETYKLVVKVSDGKITALAYSCNLRALTKFAHKNPQTPYAVPD